jgi:hypothetical protein
MLSIIIISNYNVFNSPARVITAAIIDSRYLFILARDARELARVKGEGGKQMFEAAFNNDKIN